MSKVIGIVGSRRRDTKEDYELTATAFCLVFEEGDTLVSGGCPQGGDRFCEILAKGYDVPIKIYPAEWHVYGKSAGFRRNEYIARDADILIAVVAGDRKGGTENTIGHFKRLHPEGKLILV